MCALSVAHAVPLLSFTQDTHHTHKLQTFHGAPFRSVKGKFFLHLLYDTPKTAPLLQMSWVTRVSK